MNHNPMVDWPHQSLVNGFPSLQTGRVVLFEGSSNVNELLLSVAANELQDGRAVYWIDGDSIRSRAICATHPCGKNRNRGMYAENVCMQRVHSTPVI